MTHELAHETRSPLLSLLLFLTLAFSIVGYVLPLETSLRDDPPAPIAWLAILSSVCIVAYFFARAEIIGRIRYKKTALDTLFALYVGWAVLSFFANSIMNLLSGQTDYLTAQVRSIVMFALILVHYTFGRFYSRFGLSWTKVTSYWGIMYFAICASALVFILTTNDLYLSRNLLLSQRIPLVIVFWAWFFCGIWLSTGSKRYCVLFLLGSAVCGLGLTRASYLQWGVTALFIVVAVGLKNIIKRRTQIAVLVTGIVILTQIYYSGSSQTLIGVAVDRVDLLLMRSNADELASVDASTRVRLDLWAAFRANLAENPLSLVIGYGQMGPSSVSINVLGTSEELLTNVSAHSQYLDTIFRGGLVGLALELLINFFAVFVPLFTRNNPLPIRIFAACLSGHLVFGIFHESIRWHPFGMLFWFFVGIIADSFERRSAYRPLKIANNVVDMSPAAMRAIR